MMYGISAASIVTLYIQKKGPQPISSNEKWLKYALIIFCWSIVIAEGFCIVAAEAHYTIDVWTAAYAVPMAWICFYHFVPNDPKPKSSEPKTISTNEQQPESVTPNEEV